MLGLSDIEYMTTFVPRIRDSFPFDSFRNLDYDSAADTAIITTFALQDPYLVSLLAPSQDEATVMASQRLLLQFAALVHRLSVNRAPDLPKCRPCNPTRPSSAKIAKPARKPSPRPTRTLRGERTLHDGRPLSSLRFTFLPGDVRASPRSFGVATILRDIGIEWLTTPPRALFVDYTHIDIIKFRAAVNRVSWGQSRVAYMLKRDNPRLAVAVRMGNEHGVASALNEYLRFGAWGLNICGDAQGFEEERGVSYRTSGLEKLD